MKPLLTMQVAALIISISSLVFSFLVQDDPVQALWIVYNVLVIPFLVAVAISSIIVLFMFWRS